jgi:SAM-dependent methyltransferase
MTSSSESFDPRSYWEGRLTQNPTLCGVGYAGLGQKYNEWLYRVRRRIFLREAALLPVNWNQARVLDVGSGTGFYIQRWRELGVPSITGSDLTDASVSRLQDKFEEQKFVRLDIGTPLTDQPLGSFDAISAFDVLFHITDDHRYEDAIANIYNMLKPGGWLLLSDNFLHSPTQRATHQVSRSLTEITSFLHQAGFQVERRRPMFVLMNYPVDTRHRIWKALWGAFTYPVLKSEVFGQILGASMYPFEVLLTSLLSEGPSTEMMLCRRPSDSMLKTAS